MNGEIQKHYRYFVYDSSGEYLSELTNDVVSDYQHTDEINTFGGELNIRLGRGIKNPVASIAYLTTEAGDYLLTEVGDRMVMDISEVFNVGDGTQIAHNNRIAVYEYYGSTSYLTTEAGNYLLTEAGDAILTEAGALNGRRVFYGFISKYRVTDSERGSGVAVTALPMATDFASMIFESYSWFFRNTGAGGSADYYTQLVGYNGTDIYTIVQALTAPATGPLLKLSIGARIPSDAALLGTVTVTYTVYTGSDPNGARSVVYSATRKYDLTSVAGHIVTFELDINDGPEVTSGSPYHVEISVTNQRTVNGNAPFEIRSTDSAYAGGSLWTRTGASTTYVEDTGKDMQLKMDVLTARETKATYSGWDLQQFVDQTIDLAYERGGRVQLSNHTINDYVEDPNVDLPVTEFNVNTYKDRLDTAVRAAPYGWYYRYDHVTNSIFFKPRHETADHVLIAGVHIQAVEVEHTTEQMANVIYFTGGPYPTVTDPPLYRRYADSPSIETYGIRAKAVSDGRITNPDSADVRGEYELAVAKDPVYYTTVTVLDGVYDISTIRVGHTVGFSGHGDFRDNLVIQVMRKRTIKGKAILELGALPPTERKRLAELKQALDAMAVQENEASPG